MFSLALCVARKKRDYMESNEPRTRGVSFLYLKVKMLESEIGKEEYEILQDTIRWTIALENFVGN